MALWRGKLGLGECDALQMHCGVLMGIWEIYFSRQEPITVEHLWVMNPQQTWGWTWGVLRTYPVHHSEYLLPSRCSIRALQSVKVEIWVIFGHYLQLHLGMRQLCLNEMFSLCAPSDIKPRHKYFIILIAETIKLAINGVNIEANRVTYSPTVDSLWSERDTVLIGMNKMCSMNI